jgi:diguanylate cyclase (GGDEF)-like protein
VPSAHRPLITARHRTSIVALLALVAGLSAVYAASMAVPGLRSGDGPSPLWDSWVYDGVFVLASVACATRAVLVRHERWAWAALAAAMASSTAGEVYWALRLSGLDEVPYPSLGDAFYLGFYPFAYLAVVLLVRSRVRDIRAGMWLDGLVCGLALASIAAALAFDTIVQDTGGDPMTIATTLAYPVGDLLLMLLVAAVFGLAGGRPGWSWALLGAGLLSWGVADTAYLLETAKGTYTEGTPLDWTWTLGATCVALSAWRSSPQRPARAGEWSTLAIPALSTLAAGAVLSICAIGQGRTVAVVLAAASVGTAVGRTFLTFRDVRRLAHTRRLAYTDELTGLPNRRALLERIDRALAAEERVALLLLDLDHFKELNDTLGHHVGDVLLCHVGTRIGETIREDDLLARLGGDEFAVVLAEPIDDDSALAAARRIGRSLESPFDLDGIPVQIDCSIGVALDPEHADDASTLLKHADVAMYSAKEGRNGVELYSSERDHRSRDRLTIVSDLRHGIARGELELYLQPQVVISSGALYGGEALVRWRHPEHGLLQPGQFLPAVGQTNVMRPLTQRVLADALTVVAAWQARGQALRIAVNVAAPNLLDLDFPKIVARELIESGARPDHLCLEITEDAVMADADRAHRVLSELRELGVRLALDDFGTGHSSLARLMHLPVDELKIDRSFVQGIAADPRNGAVVRAAATLGRELDLTVIAEGVEDADAWNAVEDAGCDVAQGFVLATPLPVDAFERWAAAHIATVSSSPVPLIAGRTH